MDKLPVSLVIVTRNETENIASKLTRCIRSVPFASDILLLDSSDGHGGLDRAVDVARKLGARTLQEPWRGYAKQKMRATALARNEWVLALDPDEALSFEAQADIAELFEKNKLTGDAYAFTRQTNYLGRFLKYEEQSDQGQEIRLFHRDRCKWSDGDFAAILTAQAVTNLRSSILHWPYENIAAQIETLNRQSTALANAMANRNETFAVGKMLGDIFGHLIRVYFTKGAYKDGVAGLFTALFAAATRLFAWSKLYETRRRGADVSK